MPPSELPRQSSGRPRKAYMLRVNARSWKDVVVWADSAKDARERFLDHDDPNVVVIDTEFEETGISRARRYPEEDR